MNHTRQKKVQRASIVGTCPTNPKMPIKIKSESIKHRWYILLALMGFLYTVPLTRSSHRCPPHEPGRPILSTPALMCPRAAIIFFSPISLTRRTPLCPRPWPTPATPRYSARAVTSDAGETPADATGSTSYARRPSSTPAAAWCRRCGRQPGRGRRSRPRAARPMRLARRRSSLGL